MSIYFTFITLDIFLEKVFFLTASASVVGIFLDFDLICTGETVKVFFFAPPDPVLSGETETEGDFEPSEGVEVIPIMFFLSFMDKSL